MSSIVTDRGIVHYETWGRGRPVILLHGWLESVDAWWDTMEVLGQQYRTYALDFWGFGDSGKQGGAFMLSDHVQMVRQFCDLLGLERACVLGHSMGGTVSLCLALEYPDLVERVVVVGSPINGDGLGLLLRLAALPWFACLAYTIPGAMPVGARILSPLLTCDWRRWHAMFKNDLSRTTLESFHTSIASLRHTDLRARLAEIAMPAMGIYGSRDIIVDPRQGEMLIQGQPAAVLWRFERSGHFPMLDEPERFWQILLEFLEESVDLVD